MEQVVSKFLWLNKNKLSYLMTENLYPTNFLPVVFGMQQNSVFEEKLQHKERETILSKIY